MQIYNIQYNETTHYIYAANFCSFNNIYIIIQFMDQIVRIRLSLWINLIYTAGAYTRVTAKNMII
jgi:hypothetical protein